MIYFKFWTIFDIYDFWRVFSEIAGLKNEVTDLKGCPASSKIKIFHIFQTIHSKVSVSSVISIRNKYSQPCIGRPLLGPDGRLIKHLYKTTTNQIRSFLANFYFLFPLRMFYKQ